VAFAFNKKQPVTFILAVEHLMKFSFKLRGRSCRRSGKPQIWTILTDAHPHAHFSGFHVAVVVVIAPHSA
jgi:hypothetical protein